MVLLSFLYQCYLFDFRKNTPYILVNEIKNIFNLLNMGLALDVVGRYLKMCHSI